MRVNFLHIKFRNFRGFGNAITEFSFQKGFNLIVGKNGSGKTTINEILHFALFGRSYSGVTISELINRKNKKNAFVELEFTVGEDLYTIRRGVKPDILDFLKNGEQIKVGNIEAVDPSKSLIQEKINSITGINPNIYRQIISIHNEMGSQHFLLLKEAEKKSTLEHVFNLKVFGKILDDASEKYTIANEAYKILTRECDGLESTLKANDSAIASITSILNSFEDEKNENISKLENELSSLKNEKYSLEKDLEDVSILPDDALNEIKSTLRDKESELFSVSADQKSLNEKVERISEDDNNKFLKDSDISEQEEVLKNWERDIRDITTKIEKWESVKNDLKKFPYSDYPEFLSRREVCVSNAAKISVLLNTVSDLKNQTEGKCSKCFQIVSGEHLANEIMETESQIDELRSQNAELKSSLKNELVHVTSSIIEKLKSEMADISSKIDEKKEYLSSIKNELNRKWDDYKKNQIASIRSTSDVLENRKNKILSEMEYLRAEIDKMEKESKEQNSKITVIRERILSIEKLIPSLEGKIISEKNRSFDSSGLEKAKNENSIIAPKLEEKRAQIEIEKKNVKVYSEIKRVMAKDGIKKYFFNRLIPRLNIIINEYLKFFDINVLFTFDDVFNCKIVDGSGEECSFKSFSDGEKQRISTSITLGFIALNKIINDFSCNLMFMDEVFDGLDDDGIDLAFEKLKEISDNDSAAVYVISHKNMEAWHGIDRVIEFEKIRGFSTFRIK